MQIVSTVIAQSETLLGDIHHCPTALTLPENLPFKDWRAIGANLFRAGKALQWWIGDWVNYGEASYGEKYIDAIEVTGREYKTLRNMASVAKSVEVSRRRDNVSWAHHAEVAALSPEQQDDWLDKAETERWTRGELREHLQRKRLADERQSHPLPTGVYRVLYADPPWFFECRKLGNARLVENHYPTMPVEDICALDMKSIAANDAVLFLWTTNPTVPEALRVIEAWGFEYKTNLAWVKDSIGMGYYVRNRHELLLVATRGTLMRPPDSARPDSVIEAPRGRHSEKPKSVYDTIEAMYPEGPYVELFARNARDGWDSWGNEAPKKDEH